MFQGRAIAESSALLLNVEVPFGFAQGEVAVNMMLSNVNNWMVRASRYAEVFLACRSPRFQLRRLRLNRARSAILVNAFAGAPAPKLPPSFAKQKQWTVLGSGNTILVVLNYDDGAMFAFGKNAEGLSIFVFTSCMHVRCLGCFPRLQAAHAMPSSRGNPS